MRSNQSAGSGTNIVRSNKPKVSHLHTINISIHRDLVISREERKISVISHWILCFWKQHIETRIERKRPSLIQFTNHFSFVLWVLSCLFSNWNVFWNTKWCHESNFPLRQTSSLMWTPSWAPARPRSGADSRCSGQGWARCAPRPPPSTTRPCHCPPSHPRTRIWCTMTWPAASR